MGLGQQIKDDFAQFDDNMDQVLRDINRQSIGRSERAMSQMINKKGTATTMNSVQDPLEQAIDLPET